MQQKSKTPVINRLRIHLVLVSLVFSTLMLFSFAIEKINTDFLKQLGIAKPDADEKITSSILGGFLDEQGARNAKNIALGNRTAVTNDLLAYTKNYVGSAVFINEYQVLRESYKPKLQKVQSPEEMREEMIKQYKSAIAETEASLRRSDASLKPVFEKVLIASRQMLKDIEDPGNKQMANYKKNYEGLLKINQQAYQQQLMEWEVKYPSNYQAFIKQRLQQFLDETKDIDFAAALAVKNGKKVFVDPAYEGKGKRWKMAFRAGKQVIEPARAFVQKWMDEINGSLGH